MKLSFSAPFIIGVTSILLLLISLALSTLALNSIAAPLTLRALVYVSILCVFFFGLCIYIYTLRSSDSLLVAAAVNEELAASNDLFLELYRNSPVPYLRIKRNGNIISVNNAALRLFKVVQGQLDGQNIFQFLGFESDVRTSLIPTEVSRGLFINDEEVFLKDTNQTTHWALLSAFPYGKQNERLMTLFDITKQKEVDVAKSEFVSLASHQLRTPISAMKWNLELLGSDSMGPLNEKQRSYLGKIERNAEKMHVLIQDFLDASQLEMGTFATEAVAIEVTSFLETIYEEFEERVNRKSITLNKHYDTTALSIHTDEHLLHNVISNLVSNAVKYTPESGTVTVQVTVDSTNITFTIQDTGMGIPKNEQEKLFSKFFRASNARSEVTEGTGLGLYIVSQAVEKLGGNITVASDIGAGTTFTVTVPRRLT